MRVLTYSVFALLLAALPCAQADNSEVLTVGIIDNLPPYSYLDKGVGKGVDVDITDEIFRRLNKSISLEFHPWARLILRIEEGTVDIIAATFCNGFEPWEAFLKRSAPTYNSEISIFSQNTDERQPLSSLQDIALGQSLGKIRTYYYNKELEKGGEFDMYDFKDDQLLLRSLQMGRIDYAVAEDLPFAYFCKQNQSCDLVKSVLTFDHNPICMAFSMASELADVDTLINDVNTVIKDLQREGFIQRVLDSYQ